MFHRSHSSLARSMYIGELDKRLTSLERELRRVGGRASREVTDTADRLGETLASAFAALTDRFRDGQAGTVRQIEKVGSDAAKWANTALRNVTHEVEHRPLVTLVVAAGVGVLIGLMAARRR
jgi:ElaB/YqjD/DUF883 family membrane-anchored ribosome-binding protein